MDVLDKINKVLNEGVKDSKIKEFTPAMAKSAVKKLIGVMTDTDSFHDYMADVVTITSKNLGHDLDDEVDENGNVASQAFSDVFYAAINKALSTIDYVAVSAEINKIKPIKG